MVNLLNLAERPGDATIAAARRSRRHHHRSPRPPELHRRPEPEYHEKGIGDGAAGDLTSVRPAAAARPEQVEQQHHHRFGLRVGIAPPSLVRA